MQSIDERIKTGLAELEREENIQIIFACESGSRAWGFASSDSDYDVRFVYVRPRDWYLSIDEKRDVIEKPIVDELDLNGWDLRKALRLLRKSNPPLLEWLQSPIVYLERRELVDPLRLEIERAYTPAACLYHYRSMAKKNFREYFFAERVPLKKYFYVLRPLLACGWIEQDRGPVPMEFETLMQEMMTEGDLKSEIIELLRQKKLGVELDKGPALPRIHNFIEKELERLETVAPPHKSSAGYTQRLDELFRSLIEAAWARG